MSYLRNLVGLRKENKESETNKRMDTLYPWKTLFYVGGDKNFPVVLGEGGQLIATIAFAGNDMRTSPDHELYGAAMSRINVIAEYANEEGFFFHDDLTTAPSEYARAPWFLGRNDDVIETTNNDSNDIVKLIDSRRKERHSSLVEPIIFETISYQPPKMQLKWFKKFLFGSHDVKKARSNIDRALEDFNEKVSNLVNMLSSRLGMAKRLNADQLCSYYHYTITGIWADVKSPKDNGIPFSYILNANREDDEDEHTFGVRSINQPVYIRIVTPYGMPEQIRPEFFENMCFLGAGIRWSTRIKVIPASRVRKFYTDQWIRYNSSMLSFRQQMKERMSGEGKADPIQRKLAEQAEKDVEEISNSRFGTELLSSIIIYRNNECDAQEQAERVVSYLASMGKLSVIEDVGSKVVMSATLPGNPEYKLSTDILPDYATVTSLPCSLPYTGPDERGGMTSLKQSVAWQFTINGMFPARVDLGNGQNRHVCIIAPIRKGKSTLLELIISGILAHMQNPFVYLLDVDVDKSASRIACNAMGGKVLSFARETVAIQPFRNIDNLDRREVATRWVKQCVRAHGMDDRSPVIQKRIEEAFNLLSKLPHDHRTVQQFQSIVQDATVKQCMEKFSSGAFSPHVGGNKNVIGHPPYVVIDCTGLTKGDPLAACVVSALIDEITFTVSNHSGPVQLCIDEAVQVFPLIGETIDAAYKRWPKQGGGITVVIHDPKDLRHIGATGEIIIQNTGAWMCLGDEKAIDNSGYKDYIQLTDFQCALVAEMQKGDFILKIGTDVRVIQTDLSRLEKWILGQTGKEAEALANKLDAMTINPNHYGVNLLKEGGFYDEVKWLENHGSGNVVSIYGDLAAE